ncbi:MAG: LamG-like jellyroll fold domain-containing protein [Verrucomicrobiota bacterium]
MKIKTTLIAALSLLTSLNAGAAVAQWQAAINTGSATAAKNFTTITTPVLFDVGALTGDRSFEFIFNAAAGVTPSSALLGTFAVEGGRQALKFEQWNKTGFFGATAFGVADYTSTVSAPSGVDTQAVFTYDGTKTDLYLNGVFKATILGATDAALALTGLQGLGGAHNAGAYVDPLQGSIFGFASYDSVLSPAEIASHYAAFSAVPETGSTALLGLAVMGTCLRRRRGV